MALPMITVAPVCASQPDVPREVEKLLAIFPDADAARNVGRRYLHRNPSTIPETFSSVLQCIDMDEVALGEISCTDLARAAEHAIRDDFDKGRTVDVDGWLLSTTEARVCALHALVDQLSRQC